MHPSSELDSNLLDGVVAEKSFVEQLETGAQHSQEVLDEDDAFLGSASPEVWEYEVVDVRAAEFEEALQNSDLVLEYDVVDTDATGAEEATAVALDERGVYPSSGGEVEGLGEEGSGGIDDLNVMKAKDPRRGLTNRGQKPAEDWAANTGETRNPDRGVESDNLLDDASTLGPGKLRPRR